MSEMEFKQKMVSQIGGGIAKRVAYAFDAEYPDTGGSFAIKFKENDLNNFEANVSAHTVTAEEREEALAEIYEAYTKGIAFRYETNTETETVTLKKEELPKVSSLAALKELFKHSRKTVNPR
ncbi:hypothetical protein AMQ83_36200 [Paenibacillus riograndensis]|nr:hypothetical protein AMQ83_36200 [Paenibacillus riograndensis]